MSKKNPAGWTEDKYAEAGMARVNLRLPMGDYVRLLRLSEKLGTGFAKVIILALKALDEKRSK